MFERYKVNRGDTLPLIAKKFNTSVNYLKNINDIYFLDNIREGTDIIVPQNNESYYEVYKIEVPGNINEVSKRYNVNPYLLATMNGLDKDSYIYKNQKILIPKDNYSYYITKEGDSLDSIGKTFGITKNRILSQNQTIYLLPSQIIVNKKIN